MQKVIDTKIINFYLCFLAKPRSYVGKSQEKIRIFRYFMHDGMHDYMNDGLNKKMNNGMNEINQIFKVFQLF